jgi:hypothetical protein
MSEQQELEVTFKRHMIIMWEWLSMAILVFIPSFVACVCGTIILSIVGMNRKGNEGMFDMPGGGSNGDQAFDYGAMLFGGGLFLSIIVCGILASLWAILWMLRKKEIGKDMYLVLKSRKEATSKDMLKFSWSVIWRCFFLSIIFLAGILKILSFVEGKSILLLGVAFIVSIIPSIALAFKLVLNKKSTEFILVEYKGKGEAGYA